MRFLLLLVLLFVPSVARAQFLPDRGPSNEQQEFANVLLLAPEATAIGAFLGGGAAFLVTRECCTPQNDSDEVRYEPVAIGAGLGAAIVTTWAVIAISDNYHPGSHRNAVIGGVVGSGVGAAVFFGGPAQEKNSDEVLRFVTFLLLPGLAAYAGWHLESGGLFYRSTADPSERYRNFSYDSPPVHSSVSIRF